MRVTAIVAAGGQGTRLGAAGPKQLLALGDRTILQRSVDALLAVDRISRVIVVLPASLLAGGRAPLREDARVATVEGGARRQDSVARGFDAAPHDSHVVLVHDAARPFVTAGVIERAIDAAAAHGAAVVALRASDTVKQARGAGDDVVVSATLDRNEIWLAQTPQAFRYGVLRDAIARGARVEATDEAALAELAGHSVRLVDGDPRNIKITTAADYRLACALVASGEPSSAPGEGAGTVGTEQGSELARRQLSGRKAGGSAWRVGLGYDLHRFARGRALVLGGVRIPHEFGLAGHSDADAIAHALTDAVLGAAGLGDIGSLFPDTDPRWKDADSMGMLRRAVGRVREAGYLVGNVDLVVIAERPKIGPYREAIRDNLSGALGLDRDAVGVKGKTGEGVDALGRGEALAVHAVATLRPRTR